MSSESAAWRKTVPASSLVAGLTELGQRLAIDDWRALPLVCVGTDRSTGDAFGPLVGTRLVESGFRLVIGTLAAPCDSSNLEARLTELADPRQVVAIDAAVGHAAQVGSFTITDGPLWPGRSLGKRLPPVGSCSITGIVCANRSNPYAALQSASLHLVMGMARQLTDALLGLSR